MPRKKPCKICRRWFSPHPRAGSRQKACTDCQAERHRRACARWRDANPNYDKNRRLRTAAGLDGAAGADDPIEAVLWGVVEKAVGPAHRTIIEGIARLLVEGVRDAVPPETPSSTGESHQQLNKCSRDAVPPETPSSMDESPEVPPPRRETQPAMEGPDP